MGGDKDSHTTGGGGHHQEAHGHGSGHGSGHGDGHGHGSGHGDGHGHGSGHGDGHGHGSGHNGNGHGDGHGHGASYPKRVWSPAGGWWNELSPSLNRIRYIQGATVIFGITFLAFMLSASLERRYQPPLRPVPSQRWSKHTLEDDPEYLTKLANYKKNKKPLWKRIFPTKEDEEE
eukprot:TRINITY_DN914_c0_g1_i1.p1 TRINITY_DN914_c0_g1~~TRINITY_DN914_c0_g1_i1.p1  ORF type:complete len:175 (-),score=28.66 TRINITY_DN914_c0_g1_i1:4-528(-)